MNKVIVNKVLKRDNGCIYCGDSRVELHHIVYRSHSGIDDERNLVCLCRFHHTRAHSNEKYYRDKLLERQRGIYGCIEINDLKKRKYEGMKYGI